MAFTALSGCTKPVAPRSTGSRGERVPAFWSQHVSGRVMQYPADALGRPSILFIWSPHCQQCLAMLPRLREICGDFSLVELDVIAIDTEIEDSAAATGALQDARCAFQTVPNGHAVAQLFDVHQLPALYVVDMRGRVVYRNASAKNGVSPDERWEREIRDAVAMLQRGDD